MFKTAIICLLVMVSAFGGQNTKCQSISEPEHIDLFVSGEDGYNTNRIPAVIVTQKGTVLAFCEGRKFRVHDASPTDMVLKRSFDNGKTWTPMQIVVEGVPDAIMDPCPVIDSKTGTIWLVYDRYPKGFKYATGFGMDSGTAWVTHSTDDGATWSQPVNITTTTKKPEWSIVAHGPGVGIQMRCGRFIIPCYSNVSAEPKTDNSFIMYSDDYGKSWHLGGETGPMTNESQVVELADGSLMLNMRTSRGTWCRAMSISKDKGITWSEPVDVPELIEQACQASFLRYSWPGKDTRSRILFCNPACKDDRIKLTVRLSYDEAKTWPVSKLLYAGPAAYSCLAVLKDGDIACFYEGGDKYQHEKIMFARFSLEWLTDGKDKKDIPKTCTSSNIEFDYPALNAQATQESLEPIRPGVPGKQPFWNIHAKRFIYAPAFNFKPINGAVTYRFTATSRTDNKDYCFTADEPWASLTPIWRELPVGPVVLTVEALNSRGREVQMICRTRRFYRTAPFKGPYHRAVMDYNKSARLALEYLFNQKHIKHWAENKEPDTSYELYCYPSKIIGAVIRAMCMYSELSSPDTEQALLIAQNAAEYLISIAEPAGSPLEYFPPTYAREGYEGRPAWNTAAERHKDKVMMSYPAEAATAFLDLYDATKEDKYLTAAKNIADTYVKWQLPCGTWPLMVELKTGKVTDENLCMPTMWIIPFLERLEEQYGMAEYRTAREKAFRWVMENPMKTFNWEGQFEDQLLSKDYENLTAVGACYHAISLLKHSYENPAYIKQAEELLRFAEDQFVVWEQIMPTEYWRRKTLGYANYLLPCVLEQYSYMDAIGGAASIMIKTYQKAYEVTGTELYLAKACELANSMTVAQQRNSKFAPGRYPTIWRKEYESKDIIWVNCLTIDAQTMLNLAKLLQQKG